LQQRILRTAVIAISICTIVYGCTKLDTTNLGSDLVTVDNVNTFLDTFELKTSQGVYQNGSDSTIVLKTSNHVLGNLSGAGADPLFGKTEASIYVQFKPSFYPFYFGNAGDTVKGNPNVGVDSIVLCLSYKGIWGDSSINSAEQQFEVRTISDVFFKSKTDTLFGLNFRPTISGTLLGFAKYTPIKTREFVKFGRPSNRDSVTNQIRIKLDNAQIAYLFSQDTATNAPMNLDAFRNDSIFRERFNGFEIKSSSINGNALYYVNLSEANSRLEFHYRKRKNNVLDTVMQSFPMYAAPITSFGIKASSSANYVKRDYSGTQILTTPPANDLYLQAAPGTFVNVKIPDLDTLRNKQNKIINRAVLIVEQNDNITNMSPFYTAPSYLYMDLRDSVTAVIPTSQKYKPIYFDLSQRVFYEPDLNGTTFYHPYPQANVDINNFGGVALPRTDASGSYTRYEFNITRYVQHIVSNNYKNYDLRIFAPFDYFYPQYDVKYVIPFFDQIALGRVKVGAGAYGVSPAPTRRMRLELIYSVIK
jgi:hypothetical protein